MLVSPGATLGGNGSTGAVVVAGTITAGPDAATPGTLTTGTQAWNASGSCLVGLGRAGVGDKLVMAGLTIASTSRSPFTVLPTGTGNSSAGSVYVIATDTAAAGDPFGPNLSSGALVLASATVAPTDGSRFLLASQPDGGGYNLLLEDVAAAPEPTSLALAGLAVTPLLVARRSRPAGRRSVRHCR